MRYKFKTACVLSCVLWAFAVVRGATHSELGLMPKHLKQADEGAKEKRDQRNTTLDEAAATTTKKIKPGLGPKHPKQADEELSGQRYHTSTCM